jgi:hypothetical protein
MIPRPRKSSSIVRAVMRGPATMHQFWRMNLRAGRRYDAERRNAFTELTSDERELIRQTGRLRVYGSFVEAVRAHERYREMGVRP